MELIILSLLRLHSLGIGHACMVLPSVYGTNNSILIDALCQFNGLYRGVAVIGPDNVDNATLAMFQEAGVRGCKWMLRPDVSSDHPEVFCSERFSALIFHQLVKTQKGTLFRIHRGAPADQNAPVRVNLDSQSSTEISDIIRKNTQVAKQMNWVLQIYTPLSSLVYLHDFIVASGVTFAFDHFGHTLVGSKTNVSMNTYDPYRTPGFQELIDLVQRKIMFVKILGPYRDSNQAPFYEDMRVVAETLIIAGPDMAVYGSDWPHTTSKEWNDAVGGRLIEQDFQNINYAALVEITKEWAGSDAQIQRLFVDNPRRLWQWYEDS